MAREPLISIIVPVYNGITTISRAMGSILKFQSSKTELIIKDGGSSDGTYEYINSIHSKLLRLIGGEDSGIYEAINKAIDVAKGDWYYIMGADDLLVPGSIEKVASYLENNSTIYYGNVYRKQQKTVYDGKFTARKLLKKNISQQAIFYPKVLFKDDRFSERYRLYSDYAFNMKHWFNNEVNWQYIPELVAFYEDMGRSSSGEDPVFYEEFGSMRYQYIIRNLEN